MVSLSELIQYQRWSDKMVIKDGDWELVEYNRPLKRSLWKYFDGQRTHYKTTYEVDDILSANQQERNMTSGQKWGEWRKVASIPIGLFYDNLGVAVQNRDEKYINRFLNDIDNRSFRTFEGRV